MERFYLLAPALIMLGVMLIGLAIFALLTITGRAPKLRGVKHNQFFGPFFGSYLVWMMGPLERAIVGRISANGITAISLVACAVAGVSAATGHLTAATWIFAVAGILDALDGRIARLTGEQTEAGALFDSVSDRWGELFVFTGYIWFLHDSPWMLAAIGAVGASQMVSYTRARAEGLGIDLRGGVMQRAERIVLLCSGTLIAAWYATNPETAHYAQPILGGVMTVLAVGSTGTALSRWLIAYRQLQQRAMPAPKPVAIEDAPAPAAVAAFQVPQQLRDSAEQRLATVAPRI